MQMRTIRSSAHCCGKQLYALDVMAATWVGSRPRSGTKTSQTYTQGPGGKDKKQGAACGHELFVVIMGAGITALERAQLPY